MCASTIGEIDSFAEHNMSEECFQIYKALIRPNIECLLASYLQGWQEIERILFMMVLKHNGVYKTNLLLFQMDEDEKEKWVNEIDVQTFKELERKGVYWWINYLHDQGIIGESTTQLLHKARLKRNKVHIHNYVIPEQDRSLFSYVYAVIQPIFFVMTTEGVSQAKDKLKEKAEKGSEWMLSQLNKQQS